MTLLLCVPVASQCGEVWAAGQGLSGVDHDVFATLHWDPDGAGPAPVQVVCGGLFHHAGTTFVSNVAAWNPATNNWSDLGGGCNGLVSALAVLPNGDLVAGGNFTMAGGQPANHRACWDGVSWSPFAPGLNSTGSSGVVDLVTLPNGNIVAGGWFGTHAIAMWDGASWLPIGSGVSASLHALAVLPNGNIIAAGNILGVGTQQVLKI